MPSSHLSSYGDFFQPQSLKDQLYAKEFISQTDCSPDLQSERSNCLTDTSTQMSETPAFPSCICWSQSPPHQEGHPHSSKCSDSNTLVSPHCFHSLIPHIKTSKNSLESVFQNLSRFRLFHYLLHYHPGPSQQHLLPGLEPSNELSCSCPHAPIVYFQDNT